MLTGSKNDLQLTDGERDYIYIQTTLEKEFLDLAEKIDVDL
jgi:hypothetical protein